MTSVNRSMEPPTQSSHLDEPSDDQTQGTQRQAVIRLLMLRLHFYAGIFIGPFILVSAVTGLLYTITPQLDSVVFRHQLTVDRIGEHALPLSDQIAAARRVHPEGTVKSILPAASPDTTTRVTFTGDNLPDGYARSIFIDPYTGDVRGALNVYRRHELLPIQGWFDGLHRNLHLGEFGRTYSELAASWLWLMGLTGLLLWTTHLRRAGQLHRIALPNPRATGRRRILSWHAALGVWIIAGLLFLSATGMTWSRFAGRSVSELRSQLHWTSPTLSTTDAGAVDGGHHDHVLRARPATPDDEVRRLSGANTVLRAAAQAGLDPTLRMYPPARPETSWHVVETKEDWPTRHDAIAVDAKTGVVTERVNFSSWPVMAKLAAWAIAAHMGILFGAANQIALALLATGAIAVIVTGYRMWWRRRPTRPGDNTILLFPLLRGLTPPQRVAVAAVVVALGLFAPLFGASLGLFALLDNGRSRRQRSTIRAGSQIRMRAASSLRRSTEDRRPPSA